MRINIFFVIIILLLSCKEETKLDLAIKLAGDNSIELQKVINFYNKNSSDSLKYKAAVYLIENMPYHYSKKITSKHKNVFDKLENLPRNKRKKKMKTEFESISREGFQKTSNIFFDIKELKSEFIIDNIELAFKAWYRIPKNKRTNFKDFCNYILPYSSTNEPIEVKTRYKLFTNYTWVYECLEKKMDLEIIVDSIIKKADFLDMSYLGKYYPSLLSVSQIEKSKIGRCDDAVNYFVNVFRSIGIASAMDKVNHWGNHYALGHSWLYLKYGNKKYSVDISLNRKGGNLDILREESVPKVFRARYDFQGNDSYMPTYKDVTNSYKNTVNFTVKNILNNYKAKNSVLCIFNRKNNWIPVCHGTYKSKEANYQNIGTNVLYIAAIECDKQLKPINYPFFIDEKRKIHFFKPSDSIINSALITRKYGLSSPRFREKFDRIKNLNGCVFEVSNHSSFKNKNVIHTISNLNTTQKKTINTNLKEKYKFVRFRGSEKKTFLSHLSFFNEKGEKLSGRIIHNTGKKINSKALKNIFDNDPLTFYGKKNFKIGLKFDKPQKIKSIVFQARNDNNHIVIGNNYELFYWNKKWRSLGKKIARDTILKYDVPNNSLLWLKNHTTGKEEHVFTISKNSKQKWLGFDN